MACSRFFDPQGSGFGLIVEGMSSDGRKFLLRRSNQFMDYFILDPLSAEYTMLETPAGATSVDEVQLADDGTHVLGYIEGPGLDEYAIWGPTGAVTLSSDLFPGQSAQIRDISADGTWITGLLSTPSSPPAAFRWSRETGIDLLPICPLFAIVFPDRISRDGSVVLGECASGPSYQPYVWTEGGVEFTFSEFAGIQAGISPPDWISATGEMSADGTRWIARMGIGPIFWVDLDPVISTGFCDGSSVNTSGQLAVLGSPRVCDGHLIIRANQVSPMQTMIVLASTTRDYLPMAGGGNGDLCLGPTISRVAAGQINSSGSFEAALDLAAIPTATGTTQVLAGSTWGFQGWYTENPPGRSNFTEAASVTFQ